MPIIPSRKYSSRGQEVYRPYVFRMNTTDKYIARGRLAAHAMIRQVISNNLVFGGQDYHRQQPSVPVPENLFFLGAAKEKVTSALTAGTEVIFGSTVYAAA
jgi:hypothetical protein